MPADPASAFFDVTSYAEVWIEIRPNVCEEISDLVTSYAEVWIEICM